MKLTPLFPQPVRLMAVNVDPASRAPNALRKVATNFYNKPLGR